jgi:hypothetical protein
MEPILVDLYEASEKHHIPRRTLAHWCEQGLLNIEGSKPSRRGKDRTLIDERQLASVLIQPPKRGRPFKK